MQEITFLYKISDFTMKGGQMFDQEINDDEYKTFQ